MHLKQFLLAAQPKQFSYAWWQKFLNVSRLKGSDCTCKLLVSCVKWSWLKFIHNVWTLRLYVLSPVQFLSEQVTVNMLCHSSWDVWLDLNIKNAIQKQSHMRGEKTQAVLMPSQLHVTPVTTNAQHSDYMWLLVAFSKVLECKSSSNF